MHYSRRIPKITAKKKQDCHAQHVSVRSLKKFLGKLKLNFAYRKKKIIKTKRGRKKNEFIISSGG